MKDAKRFVFEKFQVEKSEKAISFWYRVEFQDGSLEQFVEKILLSHDAPLDTIDERLLSAVLRSLHIILGISYYKVWCPRQIVIENIFLTRVQAEFWNTVYTKGLGEFFYKNQIEYRGLVQFPFIDFVQTPEIKEVSTPGVEENGRALVGIGGGKDSLLVSHILKEAGIEFTTCYLSDPLKAKVAQMFSGSPLEVQRTLDPKLLALAKSGEGYNGHIPISAVYGFLLLLVGVLYKYHYLIVGNERSSNYGNVDYLGQEINHQWSKSKEFEDIFRTYLKTFITPEVEYFSFLRPWYEIEIVRRFCQYPQYFHVFSSCNRNFKIVDPQRDRLWCCECEKCSFVFCLMSAFVPKGKIIEIFGENLYAKESLVDTYRELLGIKDMKPFECVGTPEEVKVAFYMAYEKGEYAQDTVMKMFEKEVLPVIGDIEILRKQVLSYGDDSNIPEKFKKITDKS